jgi:hypothetical protein
MADAITSNPVDDVENGSSTKEPSGGYGNSMTTGKELSWKNVSMELVSPWSSV